MDTREAYITLQKDWAVKNNVKTGTRVKVLRKAEDHELGWKNCWAEKQMDKYIGETLTVSSVPLSGAFGVHMENSEFLFPFFVLEVVGQPKDIVEVEIGNGYVARVGKDRVRVGCQIFDAEKITELAEAVMKQRDNPDAATDV